MQSNSGLNVSANSTRFPPFLFDTDPLWLHVECGIYSNKLGFLGGISWALLVVRVCQFYPDQGAERIVHHFFSFYEGWDWVRKPLCVSNIEPEQTFRGIMPIITPTIPCTNSAFNVIRSTLWKMTKEITKAAGVVLEIERNPQQHSWEELFTAYDPFTEFQYFVRVQLSGNTEALARAWSNFVESQLRKLAAELERTPPILHAIPVVTPFKDPSVPLATNFLLGVRLEDGRPPHAEVNLTNPIQNFLFSIRGFTKFNQQETHIEITWATRYVSLIDQGSFILSPSISLMTLIQRYCSRFLCET